MNRRRQDPVARQLELLGIPRAAAGRLSRGGTLLHVAAGRALCREGERGTQAFLLMEGTADVLTGDGMVEVGPGAVIGELATLDPQRTRNATVLAHTPLRLLVFDPATFRSLALQEDLRDRLAPRRAAA